MKNLFTNELILFSGLSGFIPTVFAIIQGVDPTDSCEQNNHNQSVNTNSSDTKNVRIELRFSAEIFFTSLLATLLISWLALILLQILPVCKEESKLAKKKAVVIQKDVEPMIELRVKNQEKSSTNNRFTNNNNYPEIIAQNKNVSQNQIKTFSNNFLLKSITRSKYYYLLSLIFLCCSSTFGFMPSIQVSQQ